MKQNRYEQLRSTFSAPPENYELLNARHQRVNEALNVWDDDYVREVHLAATDRLIGVLDGTIEYVPKERDKSKPELSKLPPEVVIALDKSGRPVIDLVNAFWEQLAEKDAVKPNFDFLNIDRVDWLFKMGYTKKQAEESTKKPIDLEKISHEDISRIRAYFVEGELTEEGWLEEVWKLPTRLDEKRIMVLDEMQASGATLEIAVGLIRRAVPDAAVVTGDTFWRERTSKAIRTTDVYGEPVTVQQGVTGPIWYDRNLESGRGVGDVNTAYYDKKYDEDPSQVNLKRKIASRVLSPPLIDHTTLEPIDDIRYKKLLQDVAYMTYDFSSNKVFRRDEDRDVDANVLNDQGITNKEMWEFGSERARRMRLWAEQKTNLKPSK